MSQSAVEEATPEGLHALFFLDFSCELFQQFKFQFAMQAPMAKRILQAEKLNENYICNKFKASRQSKKEKEKKRARNVELRVRWTQAENEQAT